MHSMASSRHSNYPIPLPTHFSLYSLLIEHSPLIIIPKILYLLSLLSVVAGPYSNISLPSHNSDRAQPLSLLRYLFTTDGWYLL
jgi:hypothetical protein